VVWGRAEEQPNESFGVAVAKALAQPPVAAEWCLPLVREGGAVVLWVGPSADHERVDAVVERIAGRVEESSPGLVLIRKMGPTPPGFPRRTGVARKRPLA
jgi:16S rRNA (guanine527-N7)-methyltransferase